MINSAVLACQDLCRHFGDGENKLSILKNVNFAVQPGERIAIIGPSGSGKSTLLHLLAGLDTPSSGEVRMAGYTLNELSEKQLCQLRNRHFGFIYQFHHLLPEFNALENACLPLLIGKHSVKSAQQQARQLLTALGLGERLHHKIAELSGGERQRVAIARALVGEPRCVLADEPTGNLDERTADAVHGAMLNLNQSRNTSFVVVTHDLKLAAQMDRQLRLQDGCLYEV